MMVIVPRIAAVSYLNTIPFIYGIGHEGNLRAELLLSPPAVCAKNFAEHKADIALVPAAAVPSLAAANSVSIKGDWTFGRDVIMFADARLEDRNEPSYVPNGEYVGPMGIEPGDWV